MGSVIFKNFYETSLKELNVLSKMLGTFVLFWVRW